MKLFGKCLVLVLMFSTLKLLVSTSPVFAATITIDPNTTFQTFTGWEAHTQSGQFLESTTATNKSNANPAFAIYGPPLFDQLVNDLGLNRVRLEVGGASENSVDRFTQFITGQIAASDDMAERDPVNDDTNPLSIDAYITTHPTSSTFPGFFFSQLDYTMDTTILPIKQRLEARGEKLFINVNYVEFRSYPFMQYTNPDEYAEFVLATYQHLKNKYGMQPDTWEVILEPDNTAFNGGLIGQAMAKAVPRLEQFGFTPHFIVPSVTNMNNLMNYIGSCNATTCSGIKGGIQTANSITVGGITTGTLTVAQVNQFISKYVSEYSYHRYGANNGVLPTLVSAANADGVNTSMLEHIGSGYQDLQVDLKQGNNSAWQEYIITYPICPGNDGGGASLYVTTSCPPASPTFVLSPRARYLRQYFKYVRKGAVRIKATSDIGGLDPVAFVNSSSNPIYPGANVIVVDVNTTGTFSIAGLPTGTYGIRYTSAATAARASEPFYNDLPDQPATSGLPFNISSSIPTGSVLTVYQKNSTSVNYDVNRDGKIDILDLARIVNLRTAPSVPANSSTPENFDGDNDVDGADLSAFLSQYTHF